MLGTVLTVLAIGGAAFGYMALTGKDVPIVGNLIRPDPPTCPLTGEPPSDEALLDRPVLAVKVENIAESRPQAGLARADVVYEQPVEGGITRFIALYHCRDADRIGPVRSGRRMDADVLRQFGRPIFAFAGGVDAVFRSVARARLVDMNFIVAEQLYGKDPNRLAPHNLFISTSSFYEAAEGGEAPRETPFSFADEPPGETASKPARVIRATFSPQAEVVWRYNRKRDRWQRFHGEERHRLESGAVSARNVVVQVVNVRAGGVLDAAGNPSPEVDVTGRGKVYVFRDGRVVEGRWSRPRRGALTEYVDANGDPIPLAPGTTWVELFPRDLPFSFE